MVDNITNNTNTITNTSANTNNHDNTSTTSPSTTIHVVSARTSNNPFSTLNIRCTTVKTQEHSQFIGCISFALFICLTVASFILFNFIAIVYIIAGIIIYAFLAEALFRQPKPCSIIMYLIFEALQIGFYIAYIIFLFTFLLFYDDYDDGYNTYSTTSLSPIYSSTTAVPTSMSTIITKKTTTEVEITTAESSDMSTLNKLLSSGNTKSILNSNDEYVNNDDNATIAPGGIIFYIIVFVILLFVKIYFVKVFHRFYKFVTYQERHSNHLRAQYINGRGVNIGFPVNPEYDNPIVNDPSYGYDISHTNITHLPTYSEAMSTAKPTGNIETNQSTSTNQINNSST